MRVIELGTMQDVEPYVRRFPKEPRLAEARSHKWRGGVVYAVAGSAGWLLGIALVSFGNRTSGYATLAGLHVDPVFRRQSVAQLLLDHAERRAMRKGLSRVRGKASSVPEVHLFAKRNWYAWAVTTKGEVVFDAPLDRPAWDPHTEMPMGLGRGLSLAWGPGVEPIPHHVLTAAQSCPNCARPVLLRVGPVGAPWTTCVACWTRLERHQQIALDL